jgi:1,2-diacylglycerol 3-alpha-glucosyltransferase
MVGDGPLRTSLSARATPQVRWVGPVEHARVAAYLLAADLFVSASRSEVQPMTFLESLAAGTPVVAVRSAAATDLRRSGGLEMSEATAEDLARTLVETLRGADPAARRRTARAAVAEFDVAHRAAALVDAYRRARARAPARSDVRARAGTPA